MAFFVSLNFLQGDNWHIEGKKELVFSLYICFRREETSAWLKLLVTALTGRGIQLSLAIEVQVNRA